MNAAHDEDVCGLDYQDSCEGCQAGWLLSSERAAEIPLADLLRWRKDTKAVRLSATEVELLDALIFLRNENHKRAAQRFEELERQRIKNERFRGLTR
jgi:hypothetical protein